MNEPTAPRNMVGFLIAFIRGIDESAVGLIFFTRIYICRQPHEKRLAVLPAVKLPWLP
ncbi:hypothetical protein [Aquitalea denitrificans]|uniref:hypothetical protein n=1 Tax=Aquitalea denitrificans TaxID=519081 RepID=UPI00135674EA|nr:hypothetical protein [Aquitalea denitrificans]